MHMYPHTLYASLSICTETQLHYIDLHKLTRQMIRTGPCPKMNPTPLLDMFIRQIRRVGPATVIFSHNVLGISIHLPANVNTINGTRTQNVISCPFQNIHAEYLHSSVLTQLRCRNRASDVL